MYCFAVRTQIGLPMEMFLFFLCLLEVSSAFRLDLFGENTAYRWVQPMDEKDTMEDDLYTVSNDQGVSCNAVQFTGMIRHGSRYPFLVDIYRMRKLHNSIANKIVKKYKSIKKWSNKFHLSQGAKLNTIGQYEQKALGSRFAKRLKTLFAGAQSSTKFNSSDTHRAKESAKRFHAGINETMEGECVPPMVLHTDSRMTLLVISCPKYAASLQTDKSVGTEAQKFNQGTLMNNLTRHINKEMFGHQTYINADEVRLMAEYCSYELNLFGSSPWCLLFEDWGLEIIEYFYDVTMYNTRSYGHKINYGQACPLVANIFKNIDMFVSNHINRNQDRIINKFIFGHTETILPLLSTFGLFRDNVAPRADNFKMMQNRSFVVSELSPFAANIAILLYKCDGTVTANTKKHLYRSNYAIRLLTNERETEFPGCNNKLCPYSYVRDKYSEYIDHCNFDERCRID